jgi:hypothetical protein
MRLKSFFWAFSLDVIHDKVRTHVHQQDFLVSDDSFGNIMDALFLPLLLLGFKPIQLYLLFRLFHLDPICPRSLTIRILPVLNGRSIAKSDTQRVLLQLFLTLDLFSAFTVFLAFIVVVLVTGVPVDIFAVLPATCRGVDRVACGVAKRARGKRREKNRYQRDVLVL